MDFSTNWSLFHSWYVLFEVLSYLRSLTLKLQMEAFDVIYAYRQVDSVISALKSMREGSDMEFKRIFAEATTLGKQLHGENFELEQPRVNKCQMIEATFQ